MQKTNFFIVSPFPIVVPDGKAQNPTPQNRVGYLDTFYKERRTKDSKQKSFCMKTQAKLRKKSFTIIQ
jgi:hypothetical protein